MKPKVIKASILIQRRASLKKQFKSKWGFEYNSKKSFDMGSDPEEGGDVFSDYGDLVSRIGELEYLISLCTTLD